MTVCTPIFYSEILRAYSGRRVLRFAGGAEAEIGKIQRWELKVDIEVAGAFFVERREKDKGAIIAMAIFQIDLADLVGGEGIKIGLGYGDGEDGRVDVGDNNGKAGGGDVDAGGQAVGRNDQRIKGGN